MLRRWLLQIFDVNGVVLHKERFYLRRNAQRTAEQLVRPLPPIDAAVLMRIAGPMMTYEITRTR